MSKQSPSLHDILHKFGMLVGLALVNPDEAQAEAEAAIVEAVEGIYGDSDCWLWAGAKDNDGYGRFQGEVASRYFYKLWVGEIPEGLVVMHKCDTPPCFNPGHLTLGTVAANNADMVAKKRHLYPNRGKYWQDKTHCKHGHEYTDENTLTRKDGRRYCRECDLTRKRKGLREFASTGSNQVVTPSVLKYPAEPLLRKSEPVNFYEALDIIKQLREACKQQTWGEVVGMAAPQIGINKRVFVALDRAYINPVYIRRSKHTTECEEGCYSLSEEKFDYLVKRRNNLVLKWLDEYGNENQQYFSGFEAQVIQHEFDHLDGKLIGNDLVVTDKEARNG